MRLAFINNVSSWFMRRARSTSAFVSPGICRNHTCYFGYCHEYVRPSTCVCIKIYKLAHLKDSHARLIYSAIVYVDCEIFVLAVFLSVFSW